MSTGRFVEAQEAGRQARPVLMISGTGRLRNYNEQAAALFSALETSEALGSPLSAVLPNVADALVGEPDLLTLGEGTEARYYRLVESPFGRRPGRTVVLEDVTEQHLRRRQVDREHRILLRAVEEANQAILVTEAAPIEDPGPRITYVNEAFEEMTGYTEEEETINYRKDETPYWLHWSIAPVHGGTGKVERWVSVQRDVTEKQRRKEKLRRQKSLLEQTQRLAGAWEVDLRSGGLSWSEKIYEIHEIEPGTEVSVEEGIEIYAPEARPRIREAFERLVEEGEPYDLELPIDTAKGNRRWVRTVGAPAEKEEGEVVKVAGAHQDITERKRAEQALRGERDLLRRLLEISPNAIVRLDREGTLVQANGQVEEVLGAEEEEVLGRTYNDPAWNLTRPDGSPIPEEELPFAQIRSTGEPVRGAEISIEGEDGERTHLSVSGAPLEGKSPGRGEGPAGDALAEEGGAVFYLSDITEQKRRKRQLERQNDLFRRAQEIADVGAWEYDVKDDEGAWTEKAYTILGYPLDADPHPRNAVDFYHPEDQPRVRDALRRALEEGESSDLEVRVGSSEEVRWVRIQGEPQRENGEVVRIRGTIQDITERKERERALRKLKSRYQTLVDNFPDGAVYLFDENLTYQLVGGQELSEVGLSAKEIVGSTLHDLFPEDIADRQTRYYHRTLDGEKCVFGETCQGRRYRIQTVPVRGEGGEEVTAGLAVVQDMTERWLQREKLEGRKAKVRALYETADRLFQASSPEAVGNVLVEVIRKALGHEGVSVRFVREGHLVATHVAESTFEFMPERPDFPIDGENVVAEVYRTGETLAIEDLDVLDLEPTYDYGDLRSVVVVPMEEYGVFAVASPEPGAIGEFDTHLIEVLARYATLVLGRLEREKSLLEAKEEAEEAARLKTSMLANMSHEIRTPLTSILGFAEAIGEEVRDADRPSEVDLGTLSQFSRLIEEGGHRLMETLTGVLNLSKLEAGEMNLAAEPVDLAEQAEQIAEELRPQAEETGLALRVETGEGLAP
ncbi:MAG: hypothetical protein BRD27_06275, partial [Bacteroidetes bacterium QH_10_64_19]